jgi:phosphatidylethanolamine/phosphatidyl-N-methylethanolamine N-methyltransferase
VNRRPSRGLIGKGHGDGRPPFRLHPRPPILGPDVKNDVIRLYRRLRRQLNRNDVIAAYARWAPFYDLTFKRVFGPGRRAAAAAVARLEGPILDVGVGTGLELLLFPHDRDVWGVDLSVPMLRRARQRVKRHGLKNVAGLLCMDATRLAFRDDSFGCVVAPFVLTVTPDPETLLAEMIRVVRPGGEIILVNRFSSDEGPLAQVEAAVGASLAPALGWRLEFPWSIVEDWAATRDDVKIIERRKVAPFNLFTFFRLRRLPAAATPATETEARAAETAEAL